MPYSTRYSGCFITYFNFNKGLVRLANYQPHGITQHSVYVYINILIINVIGIIGFLHIAQAPGAKFFSRTRDFLHV